MQPFAKQNHLDLAITCSPAYSVAVTELEKTERPVSLSIFI